jgi:CubicO group peptidase (beta-lactamase class C family)
MKFNKSKAENYCYRYFKRRKLLNLSIGIRISDEAIFFNYGFEESSTLKGESALYEIGSVTKIFVADIYAFLIHTQQISLRDTLYGLLKDHCEIAGQFRDISIGSLLNHTSGLPRLPESFLGMIEDVNNPYKDFDESIITHYLALSTDPLSKKKYEYSNLGYGILGVILTTKFGKELYAVIKEVILAPFDMNQTTILPYASPEQLLTGHNASNKIMPNWEMNSFQGAGLLLSNTTDMLKFLTAHLDTNPSYLAHTMQFEDKNRVAMAWHKYGLLSKILMFNKYLWHNGMTGGFSSYVTINTASKIAAVALTNKADDLTECMIGLYGYLRY